MLLAIEAASNPPLLKNNNTTLAEMANLNVGQFQQQQQQQQQQSN